MKSFTPQALLLFLSTLCLPAQAYRFVVISEIQRNPVGGASECPGDKCHEFVELANLGTDTLTLDSLFLTSGGYTDSIFARSDTISGDRAGVYARTFLAPGECALILDKEYDTSPTLAFTPGTILLTVNHVSIAGGLTDTKGLLLYKGTRDNISDSVAAAIDAGTAASAQSLTLTPLSIPREGFSLVPELFLFAPLSYRPNPDSLDPGALGAASSGWILEYHFAPASPASQTVLCSLAVLKAGQEIAPSTSWSLTNSRSGAAVASGTILPGPGIRRFAVEVPKDSAGYRFSVADAATSASVLLDLSVVWLPSSPIRISEISARATPSIPEWIEIVNVSSMPINLKNWRFGTPDGADRIAADNLLVQPGSYHVLTRDLSLFALAFPAIRTVSEPAHWPSLDNYHDTLLLFSPLEAAAAERVCYSSAWFDSWSTQSLQRVNVSDSALSAGNWALAQLPSPGQPNGSVIWRSARTPAMHIGPIPFTPNGDGKDDLLLVKMQLPADATAAITVYGFNGDIVYEFPRPIQQNQYWDGKGKNGSHAAVGPFFVVAEIEQGGQRKLLRSKGVLWR